MTTQETGCNERLRNLAIAFERLAAEVRANSAKIDSLAEGLAKIIEMQTQMMLTMARMDERMKIMNERMDSAEARRDMREAEAREAREARKEARKEARRSKTAKLQFRALYTLTAICVALLIVIITKSVFFPA